MNIGEFGLRIYIVAAQTFPTGFQLKTFTNDIDPVVFEPVIPIKYEHLIDGSLLFYNTSFNIDLNISVISGSEEDKNLKTLLKTGVDDTMVMVVNYAVNGFFVLSNGNLVSGAIADSVLSTGRRKNNTYQFVFNNVTNLQNVKTDVASLLNDIGGLL